MRRRAWLLFCSLLFSLPASRVCVCYSQSEPRLGRWGRTRIATCNLHYKYITIPRYLFGIAPSYTLQPARATRTIHRPHRSDQEASDALSSAAPCVSPTSTMTSRRRLRPRATRPTPLHWLSRTAFTALLLATVAVHASTQVQPGPDDDCALAHDPDLNDTLDSAVWPANAAAPLSDGYDLLFEKARREVRLEQRAEEESRRRQKQRKNDRRRRGGDAGDLDESDYASSTTGAASLEPANGVRVVRETFYIPRDQLGGSPEREEHSSVAPQESNAVGAGGSSSDPSPPADFRQTVGKLRSESFARADAFGHPRTLNRSAN